MKSTFLSVAVVGVLGLTASLSARSAEPPLLRVLVVQPTDVPAYVHEIDALRALYKKQGVPVTIDAYRVTFAGPVVDLVLVEFGVANLTAFAKVNEVTRTQPDLVAEVKKIGGMQQLIFDGLYDKLTSVRDLGLTASFSIHAGELAVLRGIVVQTADLPAYVHEIETLQALYTKHGLPVTIDVYHGTYAGAFAGNIDVQTRAPNQATLAKLDTLTRTEPDLAAQMKKIGAMQKIVLAALYDQVTP